MRMRLLLNYSVEMDRNGLCHFNTVPAAMEDYADSAPTVANGLAMWTCAHYHLDISSRGICNIGGEDFGFKGQFAVSLWGMPAAEQPSVPRIGKIGFSFVSLYLQLQIDCFVFD